MSWQVVSRPPLRTLAVAALSVSLFAGSPYAQALAPAAPEVPAPAAPAKDQASPISADEQARFLAGLPVPEDSPLRTLQHGKAWQEHSKATATDWELLEKKRLAPMRAWAGADDRRFRAALGEPSVQSGTEMLRDVGLHLTAQQALADHIYARWLDSAGG